jgi:hypothetical protein
VGNAEQEKRQSHAEDSLGRQGDRGEDNGVLERLQED